MAFILVLLGVLELLVVVPALLQGSRRPSVRAFGVVMTSTILLLASLVTGTFLRAGTKLDMLALLAALGIIAATVQFTRTTRAQWAGRARLVVPLAVLPASLVATLSWDDAPRSRDVVRHDEATRAADVVGLTPPGCVPLGFARAGTEHQRAHCPHPHSLFPTETAESSFHGVLAAGKFRAR
ncbi:MAG: hypothetical protein ABW352_03665, partial [Polyangiales bacterium]